MGDAMYGFFCAQWLFLLTGEFIFFSIVNVYMCILVITYKHVQVSRIAGASGEVLTLIGAGKVEKWVANMPNINAIVFL